MDLLSETLALLDARCVVSGGFRAGGDWGISFPAPGRIKFSAVMQGECWLVVDGSSPLRLADGDVVVFSGRHPFTLCSTLDAAPVDALAAFSGSQGNMVLIGSGEEFQYLGGHVELVRSGGDLLLDALPPVLHVDVEKSAATPIRALLKELDREMALSQPGSDLAATHIASLIFVHVLRVHIAGADLLDSGWLRALGDAHIAPALRLMHGDPGRSWQLDEMARAVGMSRTSFASRFRSIVGMPPGAYLANWRMRLAERELRDSSLSVAQIGRSLGYMSEAAFSNAFKRLKGMAPLHYRSSCRALS